MRERAVGPRRVVRAAPRFDRALGIGQVDKPLSFRHSSRRRPLKLSNETVLDGFAGPNELQRDATRVRPLVGMLATPAFQLHSGQSRGSWLLFARVSGCDPDSYISLEAT